MEADSPVRIQLLKIQRAAERAAQPGHGGERGVVGDEHAGAPAAAGAVDAAGEPGEPGDLGDFGSGIDLNKMCPSLLEEINKEGAFFNNGAI